MKAELNQQNKAKFFALYFGQYIGRNPLNVENKLYVSEHFLNLSGIGRAGYLSLKPLSQISDKDELELMDITGLIQVQYMINSLSISGSRYVMNCGDVSNVIDYLRSKGYAFPWMGLSVEEMIEAGWIKLTEI